jgi:hypothetical protein
MDTKKDAAVAMTEDTAVDNMVAPLENANFVNVNAVDAAVHPPFEIPTPDGKPSSGSRSKYLSLWVALVVALLVAVPYGAGVGVTMVARRGGGGHSGKSVRASCSSLRNIRIAIAYDSSFCTSFGGADGAEREVERIVAVASTSWYSRPGLCVQLEIVNLEGHCNSETDPYNRGDIESGCSGFGMLDYFENYWNTHRSNVSRDAAHLFRARPFSDWPFGCAYDRSLGESFAYGVNAFPSTMSAVRRAVLFAHELGHNAGADHIDPTEGDFIMDPGISGGKDGFSQASKDNILDYIKSVIHIKTVAASATPGGCGSGGSFAESKLDTDDHAVTTSLALTRPDGSAVFSISNGSETDRGYTSVRCGPTNDCYTLTINDSEGDGICCGYGQGNFEVNVDGQRAGGDGEFCFKYNVSFSRYSVEVKLSPRTDGGPEDTRATLTDHRMGERLEYYRFRKTNKRLLCV